MQVMSRCLFGPHEKMIEGKMIQLSLCQSGRFNRQYAIMEEAQQS